MKVLRYALKIKYAVVDIKLSGYVSLYMYIYERESWQFLK